MTKAEARQAVAQGKKVTHTDFLDDEYIHLVNGELRAEDNCYLGDEFWACRTGPRFNEGWEIKN